MGHIPLFQVDAFSSRPFGGNPAAVCLLERAATEEWMQAVAGEMMVSATAFVVTGGEALPLRWFTPAAELQLCGHATLATAHVLWEQGIAESGTSLAFETSSGTLTSRQAGEWIELDFPAEPARAAPVEEPLLRALDLSSVTYVARNRMDLLVELDSEAAVRSLRPDLSALARVPTRGVMVTALADGGEHDFVSRFFAPSIGVGEDPATGSAHCCLGPHWAERLGKNDLRAYQASQRGATLRVAVRGERVTLGGQALTVLHGSFLY